jgi:phage I-like protein
MLELEWTRSGKEAIEDRDYSYFSLMFLADKEGRPVGLPAAGAIGALALFWRLSAPTSCAASASSCLRRR